MASLKFFSSWILILLCITLSIKEIHGRMDPMVTTFVKMKFPSCERHLKDGDKYGNNIISAMKDVCASDKCGGGEQRLSGDKLYNDGTRQQVKKVIQFVFNQMKKDCWSIDSLGDGGPDCKAPRTKLPQAKADKCAETLNSKYIFEVYDYFWDKCILSDAGKGLREIPDYCNADRKLIEKNLNKVSKCVQDKPVNLAGLMPCTDWAEAMCKSKDSGGKRNVSQWLIQFFVTWLKKQDTDWGSEPDKMINIFKWINTEVKNKCA